MLLRTSSASLWYLSTQFISRELYCQIVAYSEFVNSLALAAQAFLILVPSRQATALLCRMADEERRSKRSRFDQTEPEPRKPSRFDRRSRSPVSRHSESRRSRSPLGKDSRSPTARDSKTPVDPAAAAGTSLSCPETFQDSLLISYQLPLLQRSMRNFKQRRAYNMSTFPQSALCESHSISCHNILICNLRHKARYKSHQPLLPD